MQPITRHFKTPSRGTGTEKPKMETKAFCEKSGMKREAWSAMEDEILMNHVQAYGEGNWRDLPKRAGLNRCGNSCKLRWLNYLKPGMNRGNISSDEEELIIRLHKLLGNRWSIIAGRLPGRTENEIENFWNTYLSKKVRGEHSNNTLPTTSITNTSKSSVQSPMCTKKPSSVINLTPESPHPVIKPQAVRFTKAMDLTGWDSQNPSAYTS